MRDTYLRDYCATAFRDCDVLLTPTMPITAPKLADVDVGGSEVSRDQDVPAAALAGAGTLDLDDVEAEL